MTDETRDDFLIRWKAADVAERVALWDDALKHGVLAGERDDDPAAERAKSEGELDRPRDEPKRLSLPEQIRRQAREQVDRWPVPARNPDNDHFIPDRESTFSKAADPDLPNPEPETDKFLEALLEPRAETLPEQIRRKAKENLQDVPENVRVFPDRTRERW